MRVLLLVLAFFCGASSVVAALSPAELYATGFWLIPGQSGKITWIEIHEHPDGSVNGIAHISVLSRKKSAPVWEVKRVCAHLAITTDALRRSVIRPYKTRAVYPEAYIEGYERWKSDERRNTATVCATSIENYLSHR